MAGKEYSIKCLEDSNFPQLAALLKFSSNWKKIKQYLEDLGYNKNLDKIKGLSIVPDELTLNYKITQNSQYCISQESKEESKFTHHEEKELEKLKNFGTNINIQENIENIENIGIFS